jgi:hypothetical protein
MLCCAAQLRVQETHPHPPMTSKLWAAAGLTQVSRLGAIPALRLLGKVSTRGNLPYTIVESDYAAEKPVVLVSRVHR